MSGINYRFTFFRNGITKKDVVYVAIDKMLELNSKVDKIDITSNREEYQEALNKVKLKNSWVLDYTLSKALKNTQGGKIILLL